MIERCCAFTGHRPKKFPWGCNETDFRCVTLKKELAAQIAKLVDVGYTDFFSGMAEGTDTWAALAVLVLKKENPALRLHCVLPCEGQADKWSASAQELYSYILGQANSTVYINRGDEKQEMPPAPTCSEVLVVLTSVQHPTSIHTTPLLPVPDSSRQMAAAFRR